MTPKQADQMLELLRAIQATLEEMRQLEWRKLNTAVKPRQVIIAGDVRPL